MIFEEKRITLKDGRTCTLRAADAPDAAAMIDCLRTVSGETPFLARNADEVAYTLEAEASILTGKRSNPREFMMVAEVDGVIAGNCGVGSKGGRRRVVHRCGFGIALKAAYWHLGIGSAMMAYAISLAKAMSYEQMELEVVDGNDRAMRLYEHFGFRTTGTNPRALKYDDGSYRDEHQMVKLLGG